MMNIESTLFIFLVIGLIFIYFKGTASAIPPSKSVSRKQLGTGYLPSATSVTSLVVAAEGSPEDAAAIAAVTPPVVGPDALYYTTITTSNTKPQAMVVDVNPNTVTEVNPSFGASVPTTHWSAGRWY